MSESLRRYVTYDPNQESSTHYGMPLSQGGEVNRIAGQQVKGQGLSSRPSFTSAPAFVNQMAESPHDVHIGTRISQVAILAPFRVFLLREPAAVVSVRMTRPREVLDPIVVT